MNYCDDCADPIGEHQTFPITRLQKAVTSANVGESAVLCRPCFARQPIAQDDLVRVLTILKDQWDARMEFLKKLLDHDLAVQVTRESMTAWMNENVFSDRPSRQNQISPSEGEERKGEA